VGGVRAAEAVRGVFFFSSRRRHTRFSRDWSSDVCSSDLSIGDRITYPFQPPLALRRRSRVRTLYPAGLLQQGRHAAVKVGNGSQPQPLLHGSAAAFELLRIRIDLEKAALGVEAWFLAEAQHRKSV